MKCFPLCCNINVKRIKTSQVTAGRIEESLQANSAQSKSQKISKPCSKDRDIELAARNSDVMVTGRGSTSCKNDILPSSRAPGRLQIDSFEARNCQRDSSLSEQVTNDGSRFDDKNKLPRQVSAIIPRCLTPLGPNIQASRSLQDFFEEAKRKHLPPLKCLRKDRSKNRRGKGRPKLLFIKKMNKFEDHRMIEKDTLKKNLRNWDVLYPRMHYPEKSSFKRESIDQDNWNSIEDILSLDLSNHSFEEPKWGITVKDSTKKKRDDEMSKAKSSMDGTEKGKDSSVNSRTKNKLEEKKVNTRDVTYDEHELELMEDIEREFLKTLE